MSNRRIDSEQGHWLLAKLGKKVLRPGGKELTLRLIDNMDIKHEDALVEFAPGLGYTASLLLDKKPKNYTGIELNEEAAQLLQKKIHTANNKIINTSASETGLESESVNKVVGEAMLTMQPDHRKSEIIREAFRILKPGGYYGIHELGLAPEEIDQEIKKDVQLELSKTIKVNARPLTKKEWCTLLENEGFKIKKIDQNPMHLLKVSRIIADEGILRTLKIGFNFLTQPKSQKKVIQMRNTFNKYEDHLIAVAIVAEK